MVCGALGWEGAATISWPVSLEVAGVVQRVATVDRRVHEWALEVCSVGGRTVANSDRFGRSANADYQDDSINAESKVITDVSDVVRVIGTTAISLRTSKKIE